MKDSGSAEVERASKGFICSRLGDSDFPIEGIIISTQKARSYGLFEFGQMAVGFAVEEQARDGQAEELFVHCLPYERKLSSRSMYHSMFQPGQAPADKSLPKRFGRERKADPIQHEWPWPRFHKRKLDQNESDWHEAESKYHNH